MTTIFQKPTTITDNDTLLKKCLQAKVILKWILAVFKKYSAFGKNNHGLISYIIPKAEFVFKTHKLLSLGVDPLPPRLVSIHYMDRLEKQISVKVLIYGNSQSFQSHYLVGCFSAEDTALCNQTSLIRASAGVW